MSSVCPKMGMSYRVCVQLLSVKQVKVLIDCSEARVMAAFYKKIFRESSLQVSFHFLSERSLLFLDDI